MRGEKEGIRGEYQFVEQRERAFAFWCIHLLFQVNTSIITITIILLLLSTSRDTSSSTASFKTSHPQNIIPNPSSALNSRFPICLPTHEPHPCAETRQPTTASLPPRPSVPSAFSAATPERGIFFSQPVIIDRVKKAYPSRDPSCRLQHH